MKLFLVTNNGKPKAAYPRRIMSEVYASGFSTNEGIEIIEGEFTPSSQPKDAPADADSGVCPVCGGTTGNGTICATERSFEMRPVSHVEPHLRDDYDPDYIYNKDYAKEKGKSGFPRWMEPFSKVGLFGEPTVFSNRFMEK